MAMQLNDSSTSQKSTIVIVPGSFSPSSLYEPLLSALSALNLSVICIDLPSIGRRAGAPPATMQDDANHIRSVVCKLADEGKNIVLVMHSYGGIPGTESVSGVTREEREKKGKIGGVVRLFYFAALVPPVGKSQSDLLPNSAPPAVDGYIELNDELIQAFAPLVYSDLTESEGLTLMSQMTNHSFVSFHGELTYPAYKYLPVTYLLCKGDKIIAPDLQQSMIDMAVLEYNAKVDVVTCDAGHCPCNSMPDFVAETIGKAAKNGF